MQRIVPLFIAGLGANVVWPLLLTKSAYSKPNSWAASFSTLPFMFTPWTANIHINYLKDWVDFSKLDSSRFKILDSVVHLEGPVWIVPPTKCLKIIRWTTLNLCMKTSLTAIAAFIVGAIVASKAENSIKVNPKPLIIGGTKFDRANIRAAFCAALGLAAMVGTGILAWRGLSRALPTTSGIFFYNLPSIQAWAKQVVQASH